jgi:hypothetical protein
MTIVYKRSNGYGDIDTGAEPERLGRRLYEAQALHADLERGKPLADHLGVQDAGRVRELCQWYCELVNWVGQLRADYDVMRRCALGEAEFVNDQPPGGNDAS